MEWRRVHELRPRASTSGGHSLVGFLAPDVAVADLGCLLVVCATKAENALLELQLRHLQQELANSTRPVEGSLSDSRLPVLVKHNSIGEPCHAIGKWDPG